MPTLVWRMLATLSRAGPWLSTAALVCGPVKRPKLAWEILLKLNMVVSSSFCLAVACCPALHGGSIPHPAQAGGEGAYRRGVNLLTGDASRSAWVSGVFVGDIVYSPYPGGVRRRG